MTDIQLKNIYKKYDNGFEAVKDFNLDIHGKEFVILVGPSGCGKSTTLRMIAGLEKISEGEMTIDGEVMNLVEPQDRNIAMVFQNYALYPHMTVRENIAYSLKIGSPFSLVPICLFCKSRSFPHIGHFILIMYSSLLYQNIYNRFIIAS